MFGCNRAFSFGPGLRTARWKRPLILLGPAYEQPSLRSRSGAFPSVVPLGSVFLCGSALERFPLWFRVSLCGPACEHFFVRSRTSTSLGSLHTSASRGLRNLAYSLLGHEPRDYSVEMIHGTVRWVCECIANGWKSH